jgi:Ca-activated chloride channel family protein
VVAKLAAEQGGEITLRGELEGTPYRLAKAVAWPQGGDQQNPLVPRLWAEARIADLQGTDDATARQQVVDLSRHHHVMSRYTALLVLENDKMYREFGVERTQRRAPNVRGDAAWQQAMRDAAEFGMLGLLNAGAGGDPDAPTAP